MQTFFHWGVAASLTPLGYMSLIASFFQIIPLENRRGTKNLLRLWTKPNLKNTGSEKESSGNELES